ncbi:MAG TPA: nucleoside deaminase [Acidimicrobiia bacterium]
MPVPPHALLDDLMGLALVEAAAALAHDDVPVGAVVARLADGAVVAAAHNERELRGDPTSHAEVLALQAAARTLGGWRLGGHALVSTIEPCPMCAGAAWAARVDLLVFGAADPRAGAAGSIYNLAADPRLNHEIPVVAGVRRDECAALVERFFAGRRGRSTPPL